MKFEVKRQICDRGEGGLSDYLVLVDGKIVAHVESENEALMKLASIVEELTSRTNAVN